MLQSEISQRVNYINSCYFVMSKLEQYIDHTNEKKKLIEIKNQLIDLSSEVLIQKTLINADYSQDKATLERLLSLD